MVDIPQGALLPAIAAFVAVTLFAVSAALVWEWWREQQQRRNVVGQLRDLVENPLDPASSQILREEGSEAAWIEALAARLPSLRTIDRMLQQAGMTWTLQTFILLTLGFGVGLGLSGTMLTRSFIGALIIAVIGALMPYMFVRFRRNKRLGAFEEQLPEAIELIGRALRAGHPLSSGFKMAADDSSEPIAGELRRVFEEQRFGLPVPDSLLNLADRMGLMDVRILVTAILIQREVGGNLAEILDNLAKVVRERFTIRRQLRVFTAQGRMTGYLLAVLPLALFGILWSMNADYMRILFTDPMGKLVVIIGLIMQVAGYFWIRRVVDIEI
jgi:tight adherence protein B